MDHGRIFDGSPPGIMEVKCLSQDEALIETIGSLSAENVIINSFLSLCVRN